jgi:hypothetical protein
MIYFCLRDVRNIKPEYISIWLLKLTQQAEKPDQYNEHTVLSNKYLESIRELELSTRIIDFSQRIRLIGSQIYL